MAGRVARTRMTMRAIVQRDSTVAFNVHGHRDAPAFATIGSPYPCRIWSRARRQAVDTDKDALVEDLRIMFTKEADVTENDRILNITDRLGVVLWAGPLDLLAGQYKHDHVEFSLRRVK